MMAQERGVMQIQIFGGSLLIIQWMKGDFSLRNLTLQPLSLDVKNKKSSFTHLSFAHVYRDKNKENKLSKEGLELQVGTWEIPESTQGQSSYFHEPWF
jgi:hypothetical protein